MSRRAILIAGVLAALVLLSLGGFRALGDSSVVVLDRHRLRPLVLRFGPRVPLERCVTRESDDPTSDILANVVDVDGDGRSDYRFTADIAGDHVTCEARRAGFWFDRPRAECERAVQGCRR